MENNFVQLQNTDNNNEKAHKPLQLALELSTPNRNEIDVAHCPTVYEDGHYSMQLQIRLKDIEEALNQELSEKPLSEEPLKLGNRLTGEMLARQDLNASNKYADSQKHSKEILNDECAKETESLFLQYDNKANDSQSKNAPKVIIVRSRLNKPSWHEKREQANERFNKRKSFYQNSYYSHNSNLVEDSDDDDDPFKLLGGKKSNSNSLRLFEDQFKRITSISIELNQQRIGYCEIESLGSGNYKAKAVFEQRGGVDSSQPFLLQYDLLVVTFILTFEDGYTLPLYAQPLLCASQNSNDAENINQILFELTNLENNRLLDIMFKQGQFTARSSNKDTWRNFEENRSYQSLSEYSFLIEQIIKCYTRNFSYFKTQAKHSLTKTQKVVPFNQVKTVSGNNFNWLTQHLEELTLVDKSMAVIHYQDKGYQPLHMQTEGVQKSYSTYENMVVIGFLHLVLHNANKIASEYQAFITQQREQLNQGTQLSHGAYQAPIITMKLIQLEHCEQELNHLYSSLNQLTNLYVNYQQILKLPPTFLKTFPRKSKIFQELKPYADVFMNIWHFFQFGSFHLDKDRMLFEVTTLDRLFEYYCLYRLLEMLVIQGFKPVPNGNSIFEYGILKSTMIKHSENDAVANTYILRRGSQQVVLYYQPVIYSKCFENGIRAYRTTQSAFGSSRLYGDFYTPDFIMRFRNSDDERGQDEYVIFDAKFAQTNTILQYYINELTRKYAFETAIAMVEPHQSSLKSEQAASGQQFDVAEQKPPATRTILTLHGPKIIREDTGEVVEPNQATLNNDDNQSSSKLDSTNQDTANEHGQLRCRENGKEYNFAGSKPPRMIFALQGRLNIQGDSTSQSFASATNRKKHYYKYEDRNGKPYTGVRMKSVRNMWMLHNSDIAEQCIPPTSIGLVEFNTQINSTPALWNEITRAIPFLANDPRSEKEIAEDEELRQNAQMVEEFESEDSEENEAAM